jgi:type IV pilus assembly protein PilY1
MLYVGANDGMLHGFDAASGDEKIAYIPEGLHDRLGELTRPGARHLYYVDGSPFTGDLYLGSPGSREAGRWRTFLAGFLGAGGKGYLVLDVTDPRAFEASNAARIVVLDRTGAPGLDPDIGHMFGEPVMEASDPSISRQITRLNNGRWALVMGNGYNSDDEKAVLLIQHLDGARELVKIAADTQPGGSNGLSSPRLIDLDGDGTPDLAYAGDLQGNLWKFDLSAASPTDWKVAFAGVPLFVARDATHAARQPITSAPAWHLHPEGGLMIAFGTGRLLTGADRADTQVQTLYGIHDDTPIVRRTPAQAAARGGALEFGSGTGPILRGREELVTQAVKHDPQADAGTFSSHAMHSGGQGPRRGWLVDLPLPRERVLHNPTWFEGDLIDVWSTVPARDEASQGGAPSYRNTLNIVDGSAPRSSLYAHLSAQTGGALPSRVAAGPGAAIRSETREFRVTAPGLPEPPPMHRLGKVTRRPSWRLFQ